MSDNNYRASCPLAFHTLRQANVDRLRLFRNSKGELAHSKADGSDWSRADWLEAIIGELGEYANESKKFRRGDLTEEEFLAKARKELADVQIYLDILAFRLGIDLGQAVQDKFNEVSHRVGTDVFLNTYGSGPMLNLQWVGVENVHKPGVAVME